MGAWYLVQTGGHLKFDAVEVLLEPAAVPASPYHLVLRIDNGGAESHEVLVARLAASTDPATLGEGEALATYAGGVYLFPGFGDELVLADLPPGDDALLCSSRRRTGRRTRHWGKRPASRWNRQTW